VTLRFRDDMRQLNMPATKVGDAIAAYLAADLPAAESGLQPNY
jgi:hypothetical protein